MNWQVIETQYFSKFESPKEKIVAQFEFENILLPPKNIFIKMSPR